MPRKMKSEMFDVKVEEFASMRPRHACLGKCHHRIANVRDVQASMRPRHACLGKSRPAVKGAPRSCRFNEAEARVPRKIGRPEGNKDRIERASMRPRHACLGK